MSHNVLNSVTLGELTLELTEVKNEGLSLFAKANDKSVRIYPSRKEITFVDGDVVISPSFSLEQHLSNPRLLRDTLNLSVNISMTDVLKSVNYFLMFDGFNVVTDCSNFILIFKENMDNSVYITKLNAPRLEYRYPSGKVGYKFTTVEDFYKNLLHTLKAL